jgi:predicted ATPase
MLTHFKVAGFKTLVDTSVALGVVNVFIGANGSGKSNILEALGVMGAAAFGSVEPETLRYRGVRLGLPSLYKSSFKNKPYRRLITLEVSSESTTYRLALDNPIESPKVAWRINNEYLALKPTTKLVTRSPKGTRIHVTDNKASPLNIRDEMTVAKSALNLFETLGPGVVHRAEQARPLIEMLEGFAIFAPTTSVLRGTASDVTRDPLGLEGSGLPTALQEMLDKKSASLGPFDIDDIWELIDWAQDMSAVAGGQVPVSPAVQTPPIMLRFVDRFMREGRNTLSAYDASEGALYVLFLLALVSHPRTPRLFAVDNFDHALHPRLAARLMRMVSTQLLLDGKRQMLLTTHNPLVLDGLDLSDDRIRLFAVERDDIGATRIIRIELSAELLAQAERGLSLSRLWVMGRLGAVPQSM